MRAEAKLLRFLCLISGMIGTLASVLTFEKVSVVFVLVGMGAFVVLNYDCWKKIRTILFSLGCFLFFAAIGVFLLKDENRKHKWHKYKPQ